MTQAESPNNNAGAQEDTYDILSEIAEQIVDKAGDKVSDKLGKNEAVSDSEDENLKIDDEKSDDEEDVLKLDSDEETKESDEELKIDEDKLETVAHVSRKAILEKYPKFFKDFPQVEKAYYREAEYAKVFPSIAEAKEARHAIGEFNKLAVEVNNGSTESILKNVKEQNPKAFGNIVDNYLDNMRKVSPEGYVHIISNIFKNVTGEMVQAAQQNQNDDLKIAAEILHKFIFNHGNWQPAGKFSKEPKEDGGLAKEREAFEQSKASYAANELGEKTKSVLVKALSNSIDPNKQLSDYIRTKASEDAFAEIDKLMVQDDRFKSLMTSAWERAAKNGYNEASKKEIYNIYISKAREIAPEVTKRIKNTALRGLNISGSRGNKPIKANITDADKIGGERRSSSKVERKPGMSTLDILNAD